MTVVVDQQRVVGRHGVLTIARATRPRRDLPASGEDLREFVHGLDFRNDIQAFLDRDRDERLREIERMIRLAGDRPHLKAAVPGNAYIVNTGASAIALAAATAKTLMYINSGAANQPNWVEYVVGFDGVTASAVPALVEVTYGTKASNSTPGTGSTTFTPLQTRGWPTQTSAQAAANNCTSEPTVVTSHRQFLVTPYGGLLIMQMPLGREITGVASGAAISGIQTGIRANAPAVVNARAYIEYEE